MFNSVAEHFVQHSEAAATFLLAVLGSFTYWYTRSHDRTLQKHQNYLTLELESMRVFQGCVEHPELPLYLEGKDVDSSLTLNLPEKTYWFVCQTLNLFELIISYRKDEIVPHDVFATWVSWFHELGTAARFQDFWIEEELWSHYKGDLQQIMNAAIKLAKIRPKDFDAVERHYDAELRAFHVQVAAIMKDKSILQHFDEARQLSEQASL